MRPALDMAAFFAAFLAGMSTAWIAERGNLTLGYACAGAGALAFLTLTAATRWKGRAS